MKSNRQSFLRGAAILTVSLAIVKILGLVFKIPLTNILGGTGMGYYNTAFMLFSPVFALAVGGFPTAVSKLVAEHSVRGRYRDVRRIFRLSMTIYCVTGLAGTAAILGVSGFFVRAVNNPEAYWSVMALAPAVLFNCVIAGYRGYFEGLCDMRPTAVSQVVEMTIKLAAGLGLALWVISYAAGQFETTGFVFGTYVADASELPGVTAPYAAAASVLGVSISDLTGMLYLAWRYWRNDSIAPAQWEASPAPFGRRRLFSELTSIAMPICVGGFLLNITSLVDLWSMMNRLEYLAGRYTQQLYEALGSALPRDMPLTDIPNYLYGCYTGLAVSIYGIIPALAGVMAKSALPNIASSWACGNREHTRRNIELVIRITALITIPCGVGVCVLAGPILSALFSARPAEASIATPILAIMGIGVIFQAISTLLFAVLQAVGHPTLPVKHMAAGGILKILLNLFLISVPSLNLSGAAIASVLSSLLILLLELRALVRVTGIQFRYGKIFLRPAFAGMLCGIGGKTCYQLLLQYMSSKLALPAAVVIAALVYTVAVICLRAVSKNDLEMFPGGKKVAKGLEKLGVMR